MRKSPVTQMIPGMLLTLTMLTREPASIEATMLKKPALGSASATQPTTRMKGGTSIGISASTPTKRPPGMSVRVARKARPTPSSIASADEPAV